MSQAKGSILLYFRDYVIREHGERALDRVVKQLDEPDRTLMSGFLIRGGWYPVGTWNRVLMAYLPAYYRDPDDGMRALAEYIAHEDLSTVYRMALKLGSPEFLMKRTGSLWSRYFDAGTLTADAIKQRHWKLQLEAPSGIDEAPHFFTCGPGVCAWIMQGLRLTGVQAMVEHVRCRLSAAERCEYSARW